MSTRVSVSVRVEREDNGICQSTSYFPHLVIKPQTSSSHDLCVRGINTRTLKNTSWVPEDSSGMGKTGKICALLPAHWPCLYDTQEAVSQRLRLIVSVVVTSLQFCMCWRVTLWVGVYCHVFFSDYSLYLHFKKIIIKISLNIDT